MLDSVIEFYFVALLNSKNAKSRFDHSSPHYVAMEIGRLVTSISRIII